LSGGLDGQLGSSVSNSPLGKFYSDASGTNSSDRGCYPWNGPHLKVGVDGLKEFPRSRPAPVMDTHHVGHRPDVERRA
jgi:hypothetical protein